ncbi:hypothetical protein HII30_14760 [Paenibacillus lemnae]|uniref:Uncharacterized protein n=1 Tax=Paenibacillus lemnae TaxID=1330551 RepID=A0A848M8Q1_PAELE|nr:hypothetical protein [Paenibacillus lemnae]
MELAILIMLMILNLPVYRFLYRLLFINRDDLNESIKYTFTPDIISLFRGRYIKDWIGETKLTFFLFICGLITVLEFALVHNLFFK